MRLCEIIDAISSPGWWVAADKAAPTVGLLPYLRPRLTPKCAVSGVVYVGPKRSVIVGDEIPRTVVGCSMITVAQGLFDVNNLGFLFFRKFFLEGDDQHAVFNGCICNFPVFGNSQF